MSRCGLLTFFSIALPTFFIIGCAVPLVSTVECSGVLDGALLYEALPDGALPDGARLDEALPDADDNCFFEYEFGSDAASRYRAGLLVVNTITRDEAMKFAQDAIPATFLPGLEIGITTVLCLEVAVDGEDPARGSFSLSSGEIIVPIETSCPTTIDVTVRVSVAVPGLGQKTIPPQESIEVKGDVISFVAEWVFARIKGGVVPAEGRFRCDDTVVVRLSVASLSNGRPLLRAMSEVQPTSIGCATVVDEAAVAAGE